MARSTKNVKSSAKADSLLVELRTEELPPKSLRRFGEVFAEGMEKALRDAHLLIEGSVTTPFATPRRLAVRVTGVLAQQPDREQNRQGPKEGAPAQAVEGFARGLGVSVDKLSVQDGRYAYIVKVKGESLAKLVPEFVAQALKALPIPKVMRWGAGEAQFVRPVHGLILLHGSKLIPGTVLGITSGNKTLGHRFLSKGFITVTHADKYADILHKSGKVIAGFEERRGKIENALRQAAKKAKPGAVVLLRADEYMVRTGDEPVYAAQDIARRNMDLLDEVTSLVEWPAVYVGEFDPAFLKVPITCLALSMQQHQRYFPLVHGDVPERMLPRFLVVSNNETDDSGQIVHGNERVLRARLSDARFFFEQDKRTKLADRVPRLASVVYHNKLGSQLERVQRLQKLAVAIAGLSKLSSDDQRHVERGAYLCKADLLTDMVGEFPELQGIMGAFYAHHDNEHERVVQAIRGHYAPRFAGDELPGTDVGTCLALADKLDILTGIYGIGLVPTGDKDPFGLRRQALGLVRILVEKSLPLDLSDLLQLARSQFSAGVVAESVAQDLYGFMLERLKPYLREKNFELDEIDAVMERGPERGPRRFDQLMPRLKALQEFRLLPEAQALAAANKRISNILRQAGGQVFNPPPGRDPVNQELLRDDAELELDRQVRARCSEVEPLFVAGDYGTALKCLAGLRPAVDVFFDKVMVMADDQAVRDNRLALLNRLRNLFLEVADISRLQNRMEIR